MAGWTLPKGARIRREAEVRRAFDRRASGASGDVVVYAYDRADGRPPRFALVVGRKWGDAVTRNRVRRLLREAFRTSRPELPAGLDFLLLPRGRLERRRMQDVRSMLVRAASAAARKLRATPPAETVQQAPAPGAPPS